MRTLSWVKTSDNTWCDFEKVSLEKLNERGVYLIWEAGAVPKWVRVGQGDIKECILAHRNDAEILKYSSTRLLVTWAEVPAEEIEGVEAYLVDKCSPLVGESFPDRVPIPVNMPH